MTSESSILEEESVRFLERDFIQCFMQIRHYDTQIWNVSRFAFTAYLAILSTSSGIYHYSSGDDIDLIPVAMVILGTGIVMGLILYGLVICNRSYYVRVCRYINEQRKLFLDVKPCGFENFTNMYTYTNRPRFFNWMSWQSCLCYSLAFLNATIAGLLLFLVFEESTWRWVFSMGTGVVLIVVQIGSGFIYLKSKETP